MPRTDIEIQEFILISIWFFNVHTDEMYKKVISTLVYFNRIGDCFETQTRIMVLQSVA